jgi:hypothetical protein
MMTTVLLVFNRRFRQSPHQSHPKSNGGTNWITTTTMIASSAASASILRIPVLHVLECRVAGPLASGCLPIALTSVRPPWLRQ